MVKNLAFIFLQGEIKEMASFLQKKSHFRSNKFQFSFLTQERLNFRKFSQFGQTRCLLVKLGRHSFVSESWPGLAIQLKPSARL